MSQADMFDKIPFTAEDYEKVTQRDLLVFEEPGNLMSAVHAVYHISKKCYSVVRKLKPRQFSVKDLFLGGAACGTCFHQSDEGYELNRVTGAVDDLDFRMPSDTPPEGSFIEIALEVALLTKFLFVETGDASDRILLEGTYLKVDDLIRKRIEVLQNFLKTDASEDVKRFFTLVAASDGLAPGLSLTPKNISIVLPAAQTAPYDDTKAVHMAVYDKWLRSFALTGSRTEAFNVALKYFYEALGSAPLLISQLPDIFSREAFPGESAKDHLLNIWRDYLKETFFVLESEWFTNYSAMVKDVDFSDQTIILVDLERAPSEVVNVAAGSWMVSAASAFDMDVVYVLRMPTIFAEGLRKDSLKRSGGSSWIKGYIKSEEGDTLAVLETAFSLWEDQGYSQKDENGGLLNTFEGALNAARAACAQ